MTKDKSKNRAAREREAAIRQAAKGHQQDRQERQVSMKPAGGASGMGEAITQPRHHKVPKSPSRPEAKPKGAQASRASGKGRPTAKRSAPRSPATKPSRAPVGRSAGRLARRRRSRTRLLVVVLLVVNALAAVVWRNWTVSLAVLIVSVIAAPLTAAIVLRRR